MVLLPYKKYRFLWIVISYISLFEVWPFSSGCFSLFALRGSSRCDSGTQVKECRKLHKCCPVRSFMSRAKLEVSLLKAIDDDKDYLKKVVGRR